MANLPAAAASQQPVLPSPDPPGEADLWQPDALMHLCPNRGSCRNSGCTMRELIWIIIGSPSTRIPSYPISQSLSCPHEWYDISNECLSSQRCCRRSGLQIYFIQNLHDSFNMLSLAFSSTPPLLLRTASASSQRPPALPASLTRTYKTRGWVEFHRACNLLFSRDLHKNPVQAAGVRFGQGLSATSSLCLTCMALFQGSKVQVFWEPTQYPHAIESSPVLP